MKTNNLIKFLLYTVQGAIVGVGAILPGVSGGVLCVAFGIYEPMMAVLTHPIKAFRQYNNMFVPFLIGWVLGFLFLAKGVELLFAQSPTIALMLFFGLIAGTIPELVKSSEKSNPELSWTPFVLSLSLAYLFFHVLENANLAIIAPSFGGFLFCGFLWGLSLIIPGMTSSTILILVGLFEPLTAGISDLDMHILIPFGLGICVTVLLLARVVTKLFDTHYALISRIILGFVIASSLKILPDSFESLPMLAASLICFAVGFFIARSMDNPRKQESK